MWRVRLAGLAALMVAALCVSALPTNASAARVGGRHRIVAGTMRQFFARSPLNSMVYGVWQNGKPLATGAFGSALPGVRATTDMHFRIGNVTEMFTTTLLLRLVDQHVVKLSDRVSRWFPQLQRSRQVTLKMLATSTSGYADYVTSNQFSNAFEQNPFARFSPIKLITLGTSVLPPVFAPGKSWAFSDTNFLLLGAILQKITHRPLARALRQQILNPLGLHQTLMPFTAAIPSPVMHAYTNERGNYEDSTFWDINWVALEGSMISSLSDLGKWAQAFGSGALVSRASHRLAFGRGNVGLGPLTPSRYYGIGALVAKHWILANPTVDGYSGLVAYYPPKKLAVVVFSTIGPRGNITVSYSTAAMIKLARILTPGSVPALATQPRGTSTR